MKAITIFLFLILVGCCTFGCVQAPVIDDSYPSSTEESSCTANSETDIYMESTANTEPTASTAIPSWTHAAALTNLLEEVNHYGEYPSELIPPGSFYELWQIPQPNQEKIGETVSIILAREQQAIPFYYLCTEQGEERLAVFINAKITMLVVFETNLGGIQELYGNILSESVFEAKILSMTNIDNTLGRAYVPMLCERADGIMGTELLDGDTSLTVGECVGIFGVNSSEKFVSVIKGGIYDSASDGLKTDIDWMKDIFKYYGLDDILDSV